MHTFGRSKKLGCNMISNYATKIHQFFSSIHKGSNWISCYLIDIIHWKCRIHVWFTIVHGEPLKMHLVCCLGFFQQCFLKYPTWLQNLLLIPFLGLIKGVHIPHVWDGILHYINNLSSYVQWISIIYILSYIYEHD